MPTDHHKNIAAIIHLSTFSRFVIPFGGILGPLILWVLNKDKSKFIDQHGKSAINFRLSIFLYSLIIGVISIPFLLFNVFRGFTFHPSVGFDFSFQNLSPILFIGGGLGFLAIITFLLELVFVILASIRAKEGEMYQYPITISFMK